MDYVIILGKTLFFYVIMTILYRIMGKREIGELKVVDLVVSLFIANIIAIGIEKYDESILLTLLPVVLLAVLQVVVSKITFKYGKFRKCIDGKPSVIINRGKVDFKEMLKQRYNLDDLLMELRTNGIKSIEDVDYAVLEVNGTLSVFEKEKDKAYPLPLILDGRVDEDVLIQIGKDREWLDKVLKDEGYCLDDVFYGFYRNKEVFLIKNKNNKN